MLDAGCWMLDVGCWMLDVVCWVLSGRVNRHAFAHAGCEGTPGSPVYLLPFVPGAATSAAFPTLEGDAHHGTGTKPRFPHESSARHFCAPLCIHCRNLKTTHAT